MESNINILLIEDSPSDVRLTQEALKRSDLKYTMAVAEDGVEGMEYLNKLKSSGEPLPDIILLDLNMPKKNGHEVLHDIKDDEKLRKIPVVLLTVSQRDEDVHEALKLKMNYYLAKPVTSQKLSVLVKAIHELLTAEGPSDHTNEETHVRLILAGNPHTAISVLEKLAADSNERVRARVAENPETPQHLLVKLAADSNPDVRLGVSENPNAPHALLEQLAKDPSEDVRLGLAGNPKVPSKVLTLLAEDENMFVASSANKTLADPTRRV
ncbi:MAG TPA: response regulator [Planktothrix sp.]|jgi:CheY-like chemotaxis protein